MQNIISATSALKLILRECLEHTNCLIILASTIFIFVIDLHLPLGVAAGAPYVLVVFATLWVSGLYTSYAIAVLAFGFTIAGYFLSPGMDAPFHVVLINRGLTLLLIACAAVMVIKIKKANIDISALMSQVLLDPITGFKNEQAFAFELENEIQRCKRFKHLLSLAVFETGTHEITWSREELSKIAKEIKANIRITDLPYNLNAYSFAIIFTETSLVESKSVCEIIHKQINTKLNKHSDHQTVIKAGIAAFDKTDNLATLLERATEALTIAKSTDENTVITLPQVVSKDKTSVAAILLRSRSG